MKKIGLFILTVVFALTAFAQNWETYPSYGSYVKFMQQTAENYSNICRLDTIGTTYEGRLLLCMKISSQPNADLNTPKFFYCSSMHGDELTGAIMLLRMIDTITSDSGNFMDLISKKQIYICPFANPDGTWYGGDNTVAKAVRYNANYVDLNRNYTDIRTGNNSDGELVQQETQAFINYQLKEKFHLSCNLHTGSEVFNYPWDSYRSKTKKHADDEWFKELGNDFVANLNDNTGKYFTDVNNSGVVEGGDWYVIYGSRQDWSTYYAHCREVTLELSMQKTPAANKLGIYWERLKKSLFLFFDYTDYGFAGTVKDSLTGKPLEGVMIHINNHDKDSSQVFTNAGGYYLRPITNGSFEVTFSKQGYYDKTFNIALNKNYVQTDVLLVPKDVNLPHTEENPIQIYPNPAYDEVVIQSNSCAAYEISDICGRIALKGTLNAGLNTINTRNLTKGTYFVNIYTDNKPITVKKIIKQ